MKEVTKKYSNGEVTVVWKPHVCIHSAICFKGLPDVFDPRERPWVRIEGSTTEKIINQVKKCPSGALSYYLDIKDQIPDKALNPVTIEITENGPILIHGEATIRRYDGTEEHNPNITALCRCGGSKNKPYCDGTHVTTGFIG